MSRFEDFYKILKIDESCNDDDLADAYNRKTKPLETKLMDPGSCFAERTQAFESLAKLRKTHQAILLYRSKKADTDTPKASSIVSEHMKSKEDDVLGVVSLSNKNITEEKMVNSLKTDKDDIDDNRNIINEVDTIETSTIYNGNNSFDKDSQNNVNCSDKELLNALDNSINSIDSNENRYYDDYISIDNTLENEMLQDLPYEYSSEIKDIIKKHGYIAPDKFKASSDGIIARNEKRQSCGNGEIPPNCDCANGECDIHCAPACHTCNEVNPSEDEDAERGWFKSMFCCY